MRVSSVQVAALTKGAVAVIPTDTIYGIVGQALNKKTVERIYKIKKRTPSKPVIILIASLADLKHFNVRLTSQQVRFCKKNWPDKMSIIVPCKSKTFRYLHRGTYSLAFRMPKPASLRALLKKTGPLIAPSANPEGLAPARTLKEAQAYFGDAVELYVAGGRMSGKPSTLVSLMNEAAPVVLRPGAVTIKA